MSSMMRRRATVLMFVMVCVTLLLGCGVSRESRASHTTNLTDIADNWAYQQIDALAAKGIVVGYKDGTFHPQQAVSRVEFISMINKAFKFTTTANVPYKDVWPWAWYYSDVASAVAAGYIPRNFGSRLVPNQHLTREEAATMIAATLNLDINNHEKLPFIDALTISNDCRRSVAAVVNAGYMSGYPDGTFKPLAVLTRAESAVLISQALQLDLPDSGGGHNVKDYGAKGDGRTDDTIAIQKTIEYVSARGGGMVFIPQGEYLIDPDISVVLKSDINLNLAANASLRAKPTSSGNNAVVKISNVSNVTLAGGSIIGDRSAHLGASGEWGMGIKITGSNNIHIIDVSISDCWGDGIYVSGSSQKSYSENTLIERVMCDNNRRQGLSIISVKGMTVKDSDFINTNGANPQSGIDIEPNNAETEWIQDLIIENVRTANNKGWGIEMTWGYFQKTRNPSDITIKNCTDMGSAKGALRPWEHLVSPICKIEVI